MKPNLEDLFAFAAGISDIKYESKHESPSHSE